MRVVLEGVDNVISQEQRKTHCDIIKEPQSVRKEEVAAVCIPFPTVSRCSVLVSFNPDCDHSLSLTQQLF